MEKKYNNKESRGLPGGPNEVFSYVTGVFSTDGYRSDSQDVNNPFNVIPSGNITMKERDGRPLRKGPLLGVDNLGNKKIMRPGQDYQFPGSQVTEIPMAQKGHSVKQRRGVRKNYDNEAWTPSGLQFPSDVSSHLMAAEYVGKYVDGRGWVAFPTLFQDSKPYADDQENWVDMSDQKNGWWSIYEEADKRGEVYDFGEDKEAALAFGMGSWKDQLPEHLQDKKHGGQLPTAQEGEEIDYDDIEELIPGTNMTVSEYEALSDEEKRDGGSIKKNADKEDNKSILYNWEKPKTPVMNRQAAMPDWFKYGELLARSKEPMGKSGYAFQTNMDAPIVGKNGGIDIPDHNMDLRGAGINYKFPVGNKERMTMAPSANLTNVQGRGFGNQKLYSTTIPGAGIGLNFKPNKNSNLSFSLNMNSAIGKPIGKEFSEGKATVKYNFKTGGASPEAKAWMSDYKFTDADFDFLNNDKSYCPNGGCLKQAQTGTEIEATEPAIPKEESYMGDLFISGADLEKLNSTPDLDINQLPEELWEKSTMSHGTTYKQAADQNDGKIPWGLLQEEEMRLANQYYCTKDGGCLASSYNAYDAVVGQRYPSNEFLSEAKLKKSLGLQSASKEKLGYPYYDVDGVLVHTNPDRTYEDIPVSEKTKNWIESIPYFKHTREGETKFDFSADSWDIHGVMKSKGGDNIFTASDDDIKNKTNKFANLSEKEKKKLYAQMTPGTVVSFTSPWDAENGNLRTGLNDKYGLGNSSHSAQVVGYAEDGVPIIFDWGVYRRIDDDREGVATTYGKLSTLSNITIPKEHIGKNLEWAKKNGYFDKGGPGELDFDLTPLYDEKDADIDELEPFYNALKTNKRSLMDDLNIKTKDYDMIAKSLIGITMEETEGGSGLQHNVENKMFGMGQDSVGLTQLMWTNIENDPKLKKVAAKYGITEKSDLKDSDKSAIASMIYGHRNFLSAKENYKKGKGKPGIRTYKVSDSWKTDAKQIFGKDPVYDGYTFRTDEGVNVDFFTGANDKRNPFYGIGMDKSIEDIQAQFEKIAPGKYKVREEDGKYVVDKTTLGNGRINKETGELEDLTDSEIFSYNWNSPYSLTTGDAQGGAAYVKGIQSIGELIQKKVGGEIARNQTVLEKFNSGGAKELKLYKNYFNGNVKNEKARKNYDKLNRVYYKDAKAKKMSSPNYILTHVIT